jgi:transposase
MALVDGLGNLIDFCLLPGQRHDSQGVMPLLEGLRFGAFLGDKSFDNDKLRAELQARGAEAVIPPRRNRKVAIDYDRDMYKWRIWWRTSSPGSRNSAASPHVTTKPIQALQPQSTSPAPSWLCAECPQTLDPLALLSPLS